MVSLKEVRASNAALSKQHTTLTAVFAGATAGIGLATLKAFAKHIPKPVAIIIGRSKTKFEPELANLRAINPQGQYTFFESEISLLRNVDAVSAEIKKHLGSNKIDLIFTSQGYLPVNGRVDSPENLDTATALRYYGRLRLTENLLPLLSAKGRVVTVLAGGWEGKVITSDLDLAQKENQTFSNYMNHFTTLTSLSLDALSQHYPNNGFVHVYPGVVDTRMLGKQFSGIWATLIHAVEWVMSWFVISPEECGERTLYDATCAQFEKGVWTVDWDATPKNAKALVEAREAGLVPKVEEHNRGIYERVLGA